MVVIMFKNKKKPTLQKMPIEPMTKPVKKKFDMNAFIYELKTINLENYGSWSKPVRVLSWVMISGVVFAATTFLFVKPVADQITTAAEKRTELLNTYQAKKSSLMAAEKYQAQLIEIERKFNEQLNQLPKESEIPNLVDDISLLGANSGLKIGNIELDNEQKKEVFIEQPITIAAQGEFHSFGRFLGSIAALPRIVTIDSFSAFVEPINSKDKAEGSSIPQVQYTVKASTYRYLEAAQEQKTPADLAASTQPKAN